MDIKAPFDRRYDQITGVPASWRPVLQSLEMLMHSGVEYRLRTTVDSRFTNATDQEEIVIQLEERGARRPEWQIARAVPETNL
jgi:pyruvate-formate lyase-activating enzyme